jgi:AcrR family transcriptional regulator
MSSAPNHDAPPRIDRRAQRRLDTIEEIIDIAEALMTEEGVNGLTLSEVARRLGVKPPSLYKYFDSLLDVYDAVFRRGQEANLEIMRAAMAAADPGLPALTAGLEASCRWSLAHPAITQLMFWRPVPSFEPRPESMAPSSEMVNLQRQALTDAVSLGQLGPGADTDEALFFLSILISGLLGQAMANDPDEPWGRGRFTPLFPLLFNALTKLYPPSA